MPFAVPLAEMLGVAPGYAKVTLLVEEGLDCSLALIKGNIFK